MARSPRFHFPTALYHITARGNNRQKIFIDKADYLRYLENLQKAKNKFKFKLYCFALMPNHVHLLIQVNKVPISKIIQVTHTAYTMYFNLKHQHIGHVFQGRFFSLVVEKETHLLELVRYIHLNPVRARLVSKPGAYRWTSYNQYLDGQANGPKLVDIDTSDIFAYFSQDASKSQLAFREFIEAGIGKTWQEIANVRQGVFLGSDKFVSKMTRRISKKV